MSSFGTTLLSWFRAGHRDLPWRRTRDPYAIWLSETMLQQTRAAAAIPYYERFLKRFPTAQTLARTPESEVLAAWSGLGYYHRARNLLRAACLISQAGHFPNNYNDIRALPGVGDYTAAAVSSIAFGLPHAVLDGNVLRVVARVLADPGDIAAGVTRRRFQKIAQEWLDPADPGAFNQALMELGATICLPRNPLCLLCPVGSFCRARAENRQAEFPVKAPKPLLTQAASDLLRLERAGAVLLQQRPPDSPRMAGFWELPPLSALPTRIPRREVGSFLHTIVNTRFTIRVWTPSKPYRPKYAQGTEWVDLARFATIPVTTVTKKALFLSPRQN